MFVLATQRADFAQDWKPFFLNKGPVSLASSLEGLVDLLSSATPTLVMLDLELPGAREPAQLRSLRKACKDAKLLLAGIHFEPTSELAGLAFGASACIDRSLTPQECEKIIAVVLQGGIWLSNASIPILVNKLQNRPAEQENPGTSSETQPTHTLSNASLSKLTSREREVAKLVSNGASNKTIARQLLITDRTVKAHLTSIFEKLNVPDRLQLALKISASESNSTPFL